MFKLLFCLIFSRFYCSGSVLELVGEVKERVREQAATGLCFLSGSEKSL